MKYFEKQLYIIISQGETLGLTLVKFASQKFARLPSVIEADAYIHPYYTG
jgi:hypothetical protein